MHLFSRAGRLTVHGGPILASAPATLIARWKHYRGQTVRVRAAYGLGPTHLMVKTKLPLRSVFHTLLFEVHLTWHRRTACGQPAWCKALGAQASLSDARPLSTGYQQAARMRWACAGPRWAKWPCQRQPPPSFTVVEAPSRAQSATRILGERFGLPKATGRDPRSV